MNSRYGWLASVGSGFLLWTIATLVEGGREPWDAENYWSVWFPLVLASAALLGFAFPERPWRWALGLMLAQIPVMLVVAGEIGSLVGVGILLLLILSLPGMLAAGVGARVRRRLAAA